ncbi:hypothetical protein GCM10010232_36160 [Streptomyces amakusaensis]|uniref:Uncharacterized protein n=1 Tax=Streptomyces amakusaensis TaxID=67271 RepID=A0ABW0AGB5_9ACTN
MASTKRQPLGIKVRDPLSTTGDPGSPYCRSIKDDRQRAGPGPGGLPYIEENRKGVHQPWEFSGTFLGLPTSSTGTSMKQMKDHSRRSAAKEPSSWQVTALTGLFRDI